MLTKETHPHSHRASVALWTCVLMANRPPQLSEIAKWRLDDEGQPADQAAECIRSPPQHPKPPWPVVERVVEVKQEGGARLQLPHALCDASLGVGYVMENTDGVTKISGPVRQGNRIRGSAAKIAIVALLQILSCDQ